MSRKPRTVEQAMELVIQHHPGPDPTQAGTDAAGATLSPLEAQLDRLPTPFAAALRAEMANGTLTVSLVPEGGGVRVRTARRPKRTSVTAAGTEHLP